MAINNDLNVRLSRGATRKAGSASRKRSLYIKPLLILVAAVMLPLTVWESWYLLRTSLDRPVGRVMVEGDFRFVDQLRVSDLVLAELLAQGESGNFFALDLQQLQQHLQREVWIDRAQVGRRWPDVLTVRVQEHQPIARWSQQGFLNVRGEVIGANTALELQALPVLEGASGDEQDVMAQYQRLSSLLRSRDLSITHLQLLATGVWRMQLKDADRSIQVALGRDQIIEKIQRMLLVFDTALKANRQQIEKIDLRYSNGITVSWRDLNIENS